MRRVGDPSGVSHIHMLKDGQLLGLRMWVRHRDSWVDGAAVGRHSTVVTLAVSVVDRCLPVGPRGGTTRPLGDRVDLIRDASLLHGKTKLVRKNRPSA